MKQFHHRAHRRADTDILIDFIQIHNFALYFLKDYVLQSASLSPKWSFYMQILAQNFMCIFLPSVLHSPHFTILTTGKHVLHFSNVYYKTDYFLDFSLSQTFLYLLFS
jgi:hypothetical protein